MPSGGRRPGAGRKKKGIAQTVAENNPPTLEKRVSELLAGGGTPTDIKKLAHKVAYMEQELEFIKKIILASIEEKSKC